MYCPYAYRLQYGYCPYYRQKIWLSVRVLRRISAVLVRNRNKPFALPISRAIDSVLGNLTAAQYVLTATVTKAIVEALTSSFPRLPHAQVQRIVEAVVNAASVMLL